MSSTTRITLALLIIGTLTCLMGYGILVSLSNRGVISLAFLFTATPGTPGSGTVTTPEPFPPTLPPDGTQPTLSLPPTDPNVVAVQPTAITEPTSDPLISVGNQYMSAIQRGDYAAAFVLLDPETTMIVQTPQNLLALMGGLNFNELQAWTFTQQQNLGTTAILLGVVTTRDGLRSDIVLNLRFDGAAWRIQWFNNRL